MVSTIRTADAGTLWKPAEAYYTIKSVARWACAQQLAVDVSSLGIRCSLGHQAEEFHLSVVCRIRIMNIIFILVDIHTHSALSTISTTVIYLTEKEPIYEGPLQLSPNFEGR